MHERIAGQIARDGIAVEDISRYLRIINLTFQMLQQIVHVLIDDGTANVQCREVFR
jgi:hypothetical protein